MREKIWYNLIAAKYRSIYLTYFNSYLRSGDRWLEALIVLTSSGGVGAWLIWKELPYLWAVLIGAAQVVKLLKPIFPFVKDKDTLAQAYLFYEELHLEYEKVWSAFEKSENEGEAEQAYFVLKDLELKQIAKTKGIRVPTCGFITRKTETEWKQYLQQNYPL